MKKFACYVVRHADAGKRGTVADEERPLSRRGRVQAEWIAETLADLGITRLLASPYVRCVETLEPLAALIDVEIEVSDDLGEGNGPAPVLALLDAADAPIAICSHGDVIGELLEALDERDVPRRRPHGEGQHLGAHTPRRAPSSTRTTSRAPKGTRA